MSVCIGRTLAASLLFLALPGLAQQTLTLDQALRQAVARSQQLAAVDAAAAATQQAARAAGELPDPVLRAGIDNVPLRGSDRFGASADPMTMARIGVAQELTRGDKRRLRAQRGAREVARAAAERQRQLAAVQRETALAWIGRRFAQEQVEVLQDQLQESRLQVEAAELAFRTGRGAQADVFAGRAAVALLQDRLREVRQRERAAGLVLARWAGPEAATGSAAGAVPWEHTPVAGALSDLLPRHPALLVLAQEVASAETEWKLAQANRRPDLTVEVSYQPRPSHPDMFSVGISLPLPIAPADRQDREVAARYALLEAARARYADALLAEEAALGVLVSDWRAAKDRLTALRTDLLPAARNRTEAAVAAYRAGRAQLDAALAARRDALDARMRVLELEAEAARLWAQLHFTFPQEFTQE